MHVCNYVPIVRVCHMLSYKCIHTMSVAFAKLKAKD